MAYTGKHTSAYIRNKNKKKSGVARKILTTVCVMLGVIILAAGGVYAVFHHYYSKLGNVNDGNDRYWLDDSGGADADGDSAADPGTVAPVVDEGLTSDGSETDLPLVTDEELKDINDNLEGVRQDYETGAMNIMVLGLDSRKDSFSGLSDSMILISINKDAKKVLMTSFLRDIYCKIPGYKSNRLNAAYSLGGIELNKKTIKENFGITVDRGVVINFYLVMEAVDAVGGVEIDIDKGEVWAINENIESQNLEVLKRPASTDKLPSGTSGPTLLNGVQALAYARVRHVGTDFARTGRQRTVIMKCLEKIKGMSLTELTALADQFLPKVRTDLTETECASLLMTLTQVGDYEIESMTIPMDGTWKNANIGGAAVLSINFDKNAEAWFKAVENTSDGE